MMMAVGQSGAGQKNAVVDVSPSPGLSPADCVYQPASQGMRGESSMAWREIGVQRTIGTTLRPYMPCYAGPSFPSALMHCRANGAPEQPPFG